MPDSQQKINPETAKISMDNTGIVIHLMIAGVLVGFTLLSWTQIKVDTPTQREIAFSAAKSALKTASNMTFKIFAAGLAATINKDGK